VHRVRVIPKPVVRFPKEDFREVDQDGGCQVSMGKVDWPCKL
jgi:hypothetical protein